MKHLLRCTHSSVLGAVRSCWVEHVVAEQGSLCQLAWLLSVIGRFDIWCSKKTTWLAPVTTILLLNKGGHLFIMWWNIFWCSDVLLAETVLTHTDWMQEVMPCCAIHHWDLIFFLSVLNSIMKRQRGSISVMAVCEGPAMTNQSG